MQTFFTDYLNLLQQCHSDILQSLEALPPAALDWTPGQEMNSISVLVFHLTGAERFWIGDVAAQEPSNRDRDAEFRVHGTDMNILKKRLADNIEYARAIISEAEFEVVYAETEVEQYNRTKIIIAIASIMTVLYMLA